MGDEGVRAGRRTHLFLLAATFVIAVSGLVYELLAGAVSSYLLGDSIYQFSLVIGLFMTAMGIGAWLSRFVERLERGFVLTQTLLGVIGGWSAPILFFAFSHLESFEAFLYLVCIGVGTLMGLEIPLILRILERRHALKITISNVLTADYIGALAAALLFPLVLAPQLGLMGTSLLFGGLNLGVAGMAAWIFRAEVGRAPVLALVLAGAATAAGLAGSERLLGVIEARLYEDEIILARDTPYQRILVTRRNERIRLFLNGNLQFDSFDEHRYHEALVHPAMARAARRDKVLVLGGGDGMAAREVLRWADVGAVTVVDLDPAVTGLFTDNPLLAGLNGNSFTDARVRVVNDDAWAFIRSSETLWDVIIADLPDPHTFSVSKLYSIEFYADIARAMPRDGVFVTQATSPFYARAAFWCVAGTLAATPDPYAAGETLSTRPYHAYVPAFGEWGFVMAGGRLRRSGVPLPERLSFMTEDAFAAMTVFPPDMDAVPVETNTILDHPLVRYYLEGWQRWFS